MTHLPARAADASITLFSGGLLGLPSARELIGSVADDSHDRVMMVGGAADTGVVAASPLHTIVGSQCSACDPALRSQSDRRPPTLHYGRFDITGGMTVHDAVQVKPFNPDTTPNERSGR
jgi:hypothetical protein